jgi:hypothetical protein
MEWPGLTLETKTNQSYIYRNEMALPRAWVAHQAVPAEADWLDQLEALPEGGTVVLVEKVAENGQFSTANSQRSMAQISFYSADQIEVETEIIEPGWLVLSEMWYPGWQATVNGVTQPVEKVNGLLRGLYLSQPGTYHITLLYRPDSVLWGQLISGLIAILLVIAGLMLALRQTQPLK